MATPITRWSPMQELASLQQEVDRLATGFGFPWRFGAIESEPTIMMPSVDIMTRGDDMVIRADVPGVNPGDIDISVTDSMLSLKAERHAETESKQEDYVVRERTWGSFERTMRLPRGVKADDIHVEFNDGVLEIVVPGGAKATAREAVHVPLHAKAGKEKAKKDQ